MFLKGTKKKTAKRRPVPVKYKARSGVVQFESSDPIKVSADRPPCKPSVLKENHAKHSNLCALHAGDWCSRVAPIDVDVLTLMSGRLYAFDKFIAGLKALEYPKDRLHLIWYTNSDNPAFLCLATSTILSLSKDGYDIRFMADPSIRPTHHALREVQPEDDTTLLDHADVISNLYNRALSLTTRNVFFLEDDIIPEPAALARLLAMMESNPKAGYFCAAVNDRHSPRKFVHKMVQNDDGTYGGVEMPVAEMNGTKRIDLGGLACVLMRKSVIEKLGNPIMKMWPPSCLPPSLFSGCDIVLCYEMENHGIERLCDFGIQALHIRSDGVAV